MEREAPKVVEALPKPRLEQYVRLARSINAGESSAAMIINVTTAIAYGIAKAARGPSAEKPLRILATEQQRGDITHKTLGKSCSKHCRIEVASAFDQQACDTELS